MAEQGGAGEPEFWLSKWDKGEIGFHEGRPNSFLVRHVSRLGMRRGSRFFLPLCGKTRDIVWLLEQGFHVAGVELSRLAVEEFFEELGAEPEVSAGRYSMPGLDLHVGDLFDLTAETLGRVDAVYDRAALVALPENVRNRYTSHLRAITSTAPQLLITFQYDQSRMEGPPFSISLDEIARHYGDSYNIEELETRKVEGGLKGVEAIETVHHLSLR